MAISSDVQISFTLMKCGAQLISEEFKVTKEERKRLIMKFTMLTGLPE